MAKLGVDAQNAFECGKMIFEEEDAVPWVRSRLKASRKVSFTDFMRVVLMLRGSNKTTVKDMVELRRFIGEEHLGITCPIS